LQLRGVSLEYDLKKPFDLMVDCNTYSEWLRINDKAKEIREMIKTNLAVKMAGLS